ncbi:N-6 DNA methylase [Helicobacter sp. MIT 14-3879]|uniref:N-6 DNA methylase n=1 Tax=Helicobacter sp. MIT 14-3879 TaxID=2040649 RepID=UPI000E1F5A98|nr:N-6 DNA methylase [Helicobacter sp. MIT 14-3879]RDU62257.1 restriction endonuclease subunit M [Helicobacter sp. MIT 14-3879]
MQQMLLIFGYLKRYHSDIIDTICILLGIIALRIYAPNEIKILLDKAKKRKAVFDDFDLTMKNLLGDLYVKPSPNMNIIKILRTINEVEPTSEQIEILINTITQKKTINKLYSYSTPMEINKLVVDILELQDGDEIYNPCYGIGSLFLELARTKKKFSIFGEELDSSLDKVAKLILKTLNIDSSNLFVNNILKNQIFPLNKKFNKIMCNPPIDVYIGILDLKKNERFAKYGLITKSVPELSFIINGISYLKDKGVFIIRNQLLKKTSVEEKFKEKLCLERLIEAIIELPNNIFPHNSADFSIMVISKNNDGILHIDASSFYKKEGKYNRLIKTDKILEILREKKDTKYSKFTKMKDINIDDLRAQSYLKKKDIANPIQTIRSINADIIRGQRIYDLKSSKAQKYKNVGIINFNEYGFIDESSIEEHIGDKEKIEKNKLLPYDILLSLRGINPKITIVNESKSLMVANTGIIIIRTKNKDDAFGLYCFLFSNKAHKILSELYIQSEKKSIDIDDLYDIEIPLDFKKDAKERFERINSIGQEILTLNKKLDAMR